LAVAKVPISVKTKLWVRAGMPISEGKTRKNQAQTTPKKKRTLNPLDIFSQNFTITP
jgi:hypothetical protein